MALLAEEIVEEWLNRQGYFTIRGIKIGVQEIDLLAVKALHSGCVECRHIEVQASMRPVSYISAVPKKTALMQSLWNTNWSSELVINSIKSEEEVALIKGHGINILRLKDIISSFAHEPFTVPSASSADFIDLIHIGSDTKPAIVK